ncbi:MAG: hypothetical protein IKF06_03215 [Lachnospiraceae bacterium]|nr:hypothetical protein [Lachnospiraceae bacterium]
MSSEPRIEFNRDSIDLYLKEVAKAYRKIVGTDFPAEIVLIGGASILINYGFRGMTTDVDALFHASSGMKDAINQVGDKFGLPYGWLNSDFTMTHSYTPKLFEYSVYYRTYANVLTVRTIAAEYLIAMKLCSGRQYKNDLSDILGILAEHEKRGSPITMAQIQAAVQNLYGTWEFLPESSRQFIQRTMDSPHPGILYHQIAAAEKETKESLIRFEQKYPGVTNEANVNDIIKLLQERKSTLPNEQLSPARQDITENIRKKKTPRSKNEPEL